MDPLCPGIGKRAMLTFPGISFSGNPGLDWDGALLFADLEGNTRRFTAGK